MRRRFPFYLVGHSSHSALSVSVTRKTWYTSMARTRITLYAYYDETSAAPKFLSFCLLLLTLSALVSFLFYGITIYRFSFSIICVSYVDDIRDTEENISQWWWKSRFNYSYHIKKKRLKYHSIQYDFIINIIQDTRDTIHFILC